MEPSLVLFDFCRAVRVWKCFVEYYQILSMHCIMSFVFLLKTCQCSITHFNLYKNSCQNTSTTTYLTLCGHVGEPSSCRADGLAAYWTSRLPCRRRSHMERPTYQCYLSTISSRLQKTTKLHLFRLSYPGLVL